MFSRQYLLFLETVIFFIDPIGPENYNYSIFFSDCHFAFSFLPIDLKFKQSDRWLVRKCAYLSGGINSVSVRYSQM